MRPSKHGWKKLKWGDLATLEYGRGLRDYDKVQGAYPVYGTNGQIGWHDKPLCGRPGVLIGRKGAYRGVHFSKKPFFVIDTAFYLDPKTDLFDIKWAYYQLLNFDINNLDSGSAIPSTSREAFYAIPVDLPPLATQRKIAGILSAYDDLIENNTRRIKILEEMARRLYREWFVEFRAPKVKLRKATPEEKKATGKDVFPVGWEMKPVGDFLSYHINGGWGAEAESEEFSVRAYVIRGTDIPSARYGTVDKCPCRFHKESNVASRRLQAGDIVMEISGGSKGQPVGRSLLVSQELLSAFDTYVICASFCKLLRVDTAIITPELLYFHLLEIYDDGRIGQYQVQSTGITNFKAAFFMQNEVVVVPDRQSQVSFSETAKPLIELLHVLGTKNTNLRHTRDLLLPRLVSGEVDVEHVEVRMPNNEMELGA